ncbi:MAG: HipA N-terminal domain-containing protein [Bacteroidota bacterium]
MRSAEVYDNGVLAGYLIEQNDQTYVFRYEDDYFHSNQYTAISLTLPKRQKQYESNFLFPFFFNMLSEGANKDLQCRHLKIDEKDHFGLLLATAHTDTVGAITVRKTKNRSIVE